ncbi:MULTISPECIES: LysE family transporter [Paenibacillus]|uniref:LysE family transporter n=1 Tax=Paenibacillus cucumis (ex Kampfer et al. 2016) TaxID=1776858 RepID=A0ABS7KL86_9BACL|nr:MULTISPECIES: LysE family transporter [Paenibacillus]MBY0204904.1 LysE family transporter [Paenibacillus cucumis (ex Kampfer et al. 2016)]
MEIYVKFILIGLAIAMPVGAITVEMTKQGLRNGFLHGWAVGLGGMTLDIALIIAMYFGFATLLSVPFVQIPLWLVGAGFLAYLGYESIRNSDVSLMTTDGKTFPTKPSFWRTYRNGLLVAISPGNLMFWVSVFGVVLSDSYQSAGKLSFVIAAIGILCGILLHDLGLLTIVSITRKMMSARMVQLVSSLAGVLLIGFAFYFFYKFVSALWQVLF